MKASLSLKSVFRALAVSLVLSGVLSAEAQTIPPNPLVPKNAVKSSKRNLGGGGDLGGNVGVSNSSTKSRTVVVQYVAVTPVRGWTNTTGKTIQARVLAFSAPKPGETGPVEVIREGKVRFLIAGKQQPVDYPLEHLKAEDRGEIERIAKAAAQEAPTEEADADAESKEKEEPVKTKE